MDKNVFILKKDHLKLLKNMYVDWQDCEYGAPEINPKRPYGNSDVENDIAKILKWKVKDYLSEKQEEDAYSLHLETKIALQILLQNIGEKIKVGMYVKLDKYTDNWTFKGSE